MNSLIMISLAAIVLIGKVAYAEENKPITMAFGSFPPYKIDNADKPGIDIDVMKAAWLAMGRRSSFDFFPWKRAVALTSDGTVDGLCGCSYTPDREKIFRFSDIMGNHSQGVFVRRGKSGITINSITDLNDLSVATVRGYATQKELDSLGIENVGVLDHSQLVKMLVNRRIDAVYAYRDVFLYDIHKKNQTELVTYYELKSQPYYVCISRSIPNSQEITNALNQGLRIIRHNGKYKEIWHSYLGIN